MTQTTLNCKGDILELSTPKVMGILNINPDSFFDGGTYLKDSQFKAQIEQMLKDGADVIDVGGASSKPGSPISDPEEEKKRVLPVIKAIKEEFKHPFISIDTYHSSVAKAAVEAGASIINDISAGSIDKDMYTTVGSLNVPYILMHMQGKPSDMQDNPEYSDVFIDTVEFLRKEIQLLENAGVKDIVIDPGFGFGKSLEHNYQILNQLKQYELFLDRPVLAGLSRKSMIQKVLDVPASEALNGTTALNMLALMNGAKLLRVHDVKEAKETIKLYDYSTSV